MPVRPLRKSRARMSVQALAFYHVRRDSSTHVRLVDLPVSALTPFLFLAGTMVLVGTLHLWMENRRG